MAATRIAAEQVAALDLSCWEVAFDGAEPVRADTLARFAAHFAPSGFRPGALQPCYGLAEATLLACGAASGPTPVLLDVDRAALEQHRVARAQTGSAARTLVGCGDVRNVHGAALAIVEPTSRQALPSRRVGEIWLKGPSVARGYWRRGADTDATFRAQLADGDGPYLRTGDKGFVYRDMLFVTGRIKDMILMYGRNLYPQDIELVVQASDDRLERGRGATFTVEIDGREELIIAQEVSAAARHSADPAGLTTAIRRSVTRHFDISARTIVLLAPGGVPRTTSGKIRRQACRGHFLRNDWPARVLNAVPPVEMT